MAPELEKETGIKHTRAREAGKGSPAESCRALPQKRHRLLPRKSVYLAPIVEFTRPARPHYRHLRDCDRPGTDDVQMQVICKKTDGNAEAHCCVCGQGFVMFWDRQSHTERKVALREIQETLRRHHRNSAGPEAHPKEGFPVPDWSGDSVLSGSAAHGTVPTWDL